MESMNASEFILHLFCTEVPFCDASSDVDLMSILNKLVCLEDILLKSDFSFEGACLKEKQATLSTSSTWLTTVLTVSLIFDRLLLDDVNWD